MAYITSSSSHRACTYGRVTSQAAANLNLRPPAQYVGMQTLGECATHPRFGSPSECQTIILVNKFTTSTRKPFTSASYRIFLQIDYPEQALLHPAAISGQEHKER